MHISIQTQDNIIRWLFAAGAYFMCLIAFYINIGQDMGAQYYMPILIPIVLGLFLLQAGNRMPLYSKENLPNLISGLAWCSAFPILYTWTYEKGWYMSLVCFDFIVGTCIFLSLSSLEGLLMRSHKIRSTAALMTLLNFACMIIPFVQYAYYCMVWHCLSPASLMALYLTNYRESIDFLESNVGIGYMALIVAVIGLLLYKAYRIHCRFGDRLLRGKADALHESAVILVLGGAVAALIWYVPLTSIAELWGDVTTYVAQTQEYETNYEERFQTLYLDPSETLAAEVPGTVIVVIGESASRNYMKAFTPDFPYDNTPWLSQQALENPDFLLFKNVYSSWSQTVPTLQRALTEQSQYNDKEFYESASIIDVAKKAGYETWWFSNQGRYGQFDSAITMVAKTADHAEWTDDSYNYSDKYDEALLPYLEKIDPKKNNFVVLHLMGSHIYYYNRYPWTFNKWKTEEGAGTGTSTPAYANTILYTDYVLSQIFNYAKDNLNLVSMVYFSDHGENLEISHNPDVFSFDMVRIPMFIYLSPTYQRAFPERTEILRQHRGRYFTNDMLYDTVCGILNAPSNRYSPEQDFASDTYSFTRQALTTMLGDHLLTEDVKGEPEEFF